MGMNRLLTVAIERKFLQPQNPAAADHQLLTERIVGRQSS